MKKIELPDFILSNNPMLEYDGLDWIYSPKYLSLVLVIHENVLTTILDEKARSNPRKVLLYNEESFEIVVIQNNVLIAGGELAPEITEEEFLDQVTEWYRQYLIWEDGHFDETEQSKFN